MYVFIVIVGVITIIFIIQFICQYFIDHIKYKNSISNIKTETLYKIKSLSFVQKVSYILDELNITLRVKNINVISTLTISISSFILFLLTFFVIYRFIGLFLSSLIISLLTSLIPYYFLKYLSYYKKTKIIKIFPNFVINLKNYTDVNNDIIEAFRRTNVEEPLTGYIEKLNVSLQKGVKVYDAFEALKSSININKINQFITLLQFCHIYGGNYSELLERFSKIQMKMNLRGEKEKQKTFSSKLVLILLIILNIYIMFGFILTNEEYYDILVNTFIGNVILNINIVSYIFIFYMYIKLNKMEE